MSKVRRGPQFPIPIGATPWAVPCPRCSLLLQIAQCTSENSFPSPNITWYKNGEPLLQEEDSELGWGWGWRGMG